MKNNLKCPAEGITAKDYSQLKLRAEAIRLISEEIDKKGDPLKYLVYKIY